jgi:hypothetical protein
VFGNALDKSAPSHNVSVKHAEWRDRRLAALLAHRRRAAQTLGD